jgi:hypothetical protein
VLVACDGQGRACIYALALQRLIGHFNFRQPVRQLAFAPDSHMFVAALEHGFKAYLVPSLTRSFEPLFLVRQVAHLHSEPVRGCCLAPDGRFLFTWGKDLLVKLSSIFYIPEYTPFEFATHKEKVVSAFMREDRAYTLDQAGVLY